MSLRVRDGRVLCAARHAPAAGDIYIDDALHYALSVEARLVVTEPMDAGGRGGHAQHGEWWWRGAVPEDVTVDPFYTSPLTPRAGHP